MSGYADWGKIDSDEEDDLEDNSFYTGTRDVVLFCIDASSSMYTPYDDPVYEGIQTCNFLSALDAAVQVQKKKVLVGPRDCVGIVIYNTTRKADKDAPMTASETKEHTYLYQAINLINAPSIQHAMRIVDATRDQGLEYLKTQFPPVDDSKRMSMGDVFTTANWIFRDNAPKTATKRVFLITDSDDPHAPLLEHARETNPSAAKKKEKVLMKSSKTTLIDLAAAGITLEPFFISSEDRPFDVQRFYSHILLSSPLDPSDEDQDSDFLPDSISITRMEDLLAQMRFREVPKRAMFSVDLTLAMMKGNEGIYEEKEKAWRIGVKGYSLVTEQKKGAYKYFVDLGDRLENVVSRTSYVDELTEQEHLRQRFVFGPEGGGEGQPGFLPSSSLSDDGEDLGFGARTHSRGARKHYKAHEVATFKSLGEEPGIKLLGFKGREELAFEDNVRHATFLVPDEAKFAGSRRTFVALLRTMVEKKKVGYVRAITRRNSTVVFCALVPQEEDEETGDPAGFHLIPLPFADDIRGAPVEEGKRAPEPLTEAARAWIKKLTLKHGGYPPDSYPNPALAYHNAQLEAVAFQEEFDQGSFEDLTEPKYDGMRKRAGGLIQEWKKQLDDLEEDDVDVPAPKPKKRKAAEIAEGGGGDDTEIRERFAAGTLAKLTVAQLKEFLKAKGELVSGKKADLVERAEKWLEDH